MNPSPLTQQARPTTFQPKVVQLYQELFLVWTSCSCFFPPEAYSKADVSSLLLEPNLCPERGILARTVLTVARHQRAQSNPRRAFPG